MKGMSDQKCVSKHRAMHNCIGGKFSWLEAFQKEKSFEGWKYVKILLFVIASCLSAGQIATW